MALDKITQALHLAEDFQAVSDEIHAFFLPIITDFLTFEISRGMKDKKEVAESFEFESYADGIFYFQAPYHYNEDDYYDTHIYEGATLRIPDSFVSTPEVHKAEVIRKDKEREEAQERRKREQEDIARVALRNQISDLQAQLERLERLDNQKGNG